MRYEIVHIVGTTIEDVTQRMQAIVNTYIESGWEPINQLQIILDFENKFSAIKELIHK